MAITDVAQKNGTDPILTVKNLTVKYDTKRGDVIALNDVSLELGSGEAIGIAGESGSGKSTMALAILQYLGKNGKVSSGTVSYKGKSLSGLTDEELRNIRKQEIAHVAQDPEKALNPSLTIGKQISEIVNTSSNSDISPVVEAKNLLKEVEIPDPGVIIRKYPHELSGGMQQRVLIAMALASNPDLLILDEPTTGLDVTTQAKIINLINELKVDYNCSIVFISHDLGVLSQITDKLYILYAGDLMESGPVKEIFNNPSHPYTQGLLNSIPEIDKNKEIEPIPGSISSDMDANNGCIFSNRCEFVENKCEQDRIKIEKVDDKAKHMVRCCKWKTVKENHQEPSLFQKNRPDYGDSIIKVQSLEKYYDEPSLFDNLLHKDKKPVKAVNGVSFDIKESQSLALIGESGCGKSTLGRTILQLENATGGNIYYKNKKIGDMSRDELKNFRSECQIVFQNPDSSLNPRRTVQEILERPMKIFSDLSKSDRDKKINELLGEIELSKEYKHRYPHELSGGEKQRVAIGRAFAANPSFVVLDEPVSSLDVSVQASVLNLLSDLQDTYDVSYLFISHDLSVVKHICDHVLIMYLGKIVESGPTDKIFRNPSHPYTENLLKSIPELDTFKGELSGTLEGNVPSPRDPPNGCQFHTRCPEAREICKTTNPDRYNVNNDHTSQCFVPDKDSKYWD